MGRGNLGRGFFMQVRRIDRAAVARRSAGGALSVALLVTAVVSYRTPAPESAPAPGPTPARRLPESGPRPPTPQPPGIRLIATPRPDGSLEVAETVVFAAPRAGVVLAAPRASYGGKPFATASPRAVQLQITADGQPLPTTGTVGPRGYRLERPVSRLVLRYQLTGVTVRSIPSVAGRALTLVVPLTARTDPALPAWLTIRGTNVRNLICPRLAPEHRQCAPAHGAPGVLPKLTARNAVVIVQLDLPMPS
jgi:hypothetical protein